MSHDVTKHNTIIELFKKGKTLREIGSIYSISGERVRQILTQHGVRGDSGGQKVRIAKRKAEDIESRERFCLEKYGCSLQQFQQACSERPAGAPPPYLSFVRQRNHANVRGVEWRLSFWEWFSIWKESGKWGRRGQGASNYCMCRKGDEGPYEIGNVYIETFTHNSVLGRTLAHERLVELNGFRRAMLLAGGRKAVSEALGLAITYLSQLANDGHMPRSWLSDGRAAVFAKLTSGGYSEEDLAAFCKMATTTSAPRFRSSKNVARSGR